MVRSDWTHGRSSHAPRQFQQEAKDLAGSLEVQGNFKLPKSTLNMALLSIFLVPGKAFLTVTRKQQVRLISSHLTRCLEVLTLLTPMSSLKK